MRQNTKVDWKRPQLKNEELQKNKVLQILNQKLYQNWIFAAHMSVLGKCFVSLYLCPSQYIINIINKDQTNRISMKTVCFFIFHLKYHKLDLLNSFRTIRASYSFILHKHSPRNCYSYKNDHFIHIKLCFFFVYSIRIL